MKIRSAFTSRERWDLPHEELLATKPFKDLNDFTELVRRMYNPELHSLDHLFDTNLFDTDYSEDTDLWFEHWGSKINKIADDYPVFDMWKHLSTDGQNKHLQHTIDYMEKQYDELNP